MPEGLHIHVCVATQRLELRDGSEVLKTYPVSTSRYGLGTEEGSFRTPTGAFRICEKFGEGAPLHTIFRAREPVGQWDPETPSESDLVIARILRLDGQDPGNANSYERFIYIHGTNHEELIGSPASQGCVRMRNKDIMDLFEQVPLETPVTIEA